MKTSIVILTFNKLEQTKVCIESIRQHTDKDSCEMIVVDNCSTDGTVEWLREQEDLRVHYNDYNAGFPKGCNQGMQIAAGDSVLLLNNDTIVTPNWLEQLLQCLYSDDRIGAVGPVTNHASYLSAIPVSYGTLEEMQKFAQSYNRSNPAKWEEWIKLIGFCLLIKREVMERVGLLDERFSPGNYEDEDYCLRIRKDGYRLMLCKDTFIHHFGSTSFNDDSSRFMALLMQNDKKFVEKWGFSPAYSTFIRNDLLVFLDHPQTEPLRILEVGCACGATLLEIKNRYPQAELYGIELNPNAASVAALIADVTDQDIEKAELRYSRHFFDYIIFADVLEHLNDPWSVLKNLLPYLKEDGKMLASIPNVMHYSLIHSLLSGYWTYTDSGLLDRTHLRFFTFHEIKNMFRDAGFQMLEINQVILNTTNEQEQFMKELCKFSSVDLYSQYNTYQYLIKAYKMESTGSKKDKHLQQKLKLLMRRIEQNFEMEDSRNTIVHMLSNGEVSYGDIGHIINNDIIGKEETVRLLAEACCDGHLVTSEAEFLRRIREDTINDGS
ncbi:MAG TPA: bifunctional glycosyltransferase family 2 protein/class I SAM-dependent methyltransferase [Bacilli bacterium]